MFEILCFLAFCQLLLVFINLLTWPVLKKAGNNNDDFVSILVPARNEEKNIEKLLVSVINQSYQHYEVLALDDQSTDNTAEIISRFPSEHVRLIRGKALPPGWVGKSWACHQLVGEAKGSYLLFLDADTLISSDLVNNAMTYLKTKKLDLLSLFARQITVSAGEKVSVPVVQFVLLTLLPLFLVEKSPMPSLAAASGQFMLFPVGTYRHFEWHRLAKSSLAEDITIIRLIKQHGLKAAALLAGDQVSCRMYKGFWDSISGFSKNIRIIFANSYLFLFLYLMFYFLCLFYMLAGLPGSLLLLFLITASKLIAAILARENLILSLLLFPVQIFSLACMFILALYRGERTGHYWKNRLITVPAEIIND